MATPDPTRPNAIKTLISLENDQFTFDITNSGYSGHTIKDGELENRIYAIELVGVGMTLVKTGSSQAFPNAKCRGISIFSAWTYGPLTNSFDFSAL